MYGCYKISVFDKNKNEKKIIYQKNTITANGKKKILDALSFNPSGSYGYRIAEKIPKGKFELNGQICEYETSFFGWGYVHHPFNKSGNYTHIDLCQP